MNSAPVTTSFKLVCEMSTEPMTAGFVESWTYLLFPMAAGSARGTTAMAFRSHVARSL